MRRIKRYPNRKLYDTEDKRYVTLNEIAQLIRHGEEIQVQDHSTGEDLTALTLTQIIVEQEKRQAGFLPRSVLTGLVQAGGERLSTLRRALALPLGLQYDFDEEIDRRLQALVRDGEMEEAEALALRKKMVQADERAANGTIDTRREQALERMLGRSALPSRADIETLDRQLDELLRKIEPLLEGREGK